MLDQFFKKVGVISKSIFPGDSCLFAFNRDFWMHLKCKRNETICHGKEKILKQDQWNYNFELFF